jgi:Fe-S cluster assembly protein SufD
VKCNHGSTIGQLDEEPLFYLRARGIGEEEARNLLIYAFASEIVDRMKIEPVRERSAARCSADARSDAGAKRRHR